MPVYSNNKPKKKKYLSKKKAIREMRQVARKNPGGGESSHLMSWVGDPSKKRGEFGVHPTISPKKGKEKSRKFEDWEKQTAKQSDAKGELIRVKSKRKAKKLAAGSWKKGVDKREAMREYRKNKDKY